MRSKLQRSKISDEKSFAQRLDKNERENSIQ